MQLIGIYSVTIWKSHGACKGTASVCQPCSLQQVLVKGAGTRAAPWLPQAQTPSKQWYCLCIGFRDRLGLHAGSTHSELWNHSSYVNLFIFCFVIYKVDIMIPTSQGLLWKFSELINERQHSTWHILTIYYIAKDEIPGILCQPQPPLLTT